MNAPEEVEAALDVKVEANYEDGVYSIDVGVEGYFLNQLTLAEGFRPHIPTLLAVLPEALERAFGALDEAATNAQEGTDE